MSRSKPQLVYLEWADAVSNSAWFDESELREWIDKTEMMMIEVGWIIEETPKHIVLAARCSPESYRNPIQWGMVHKIPKTWIRKRKVLRI